LKLSIKQIVSLDQINNIMTTNIYLSAYWYDKRLIWIPSSYNNLSEIVTPANKLWLPDLNILNIADGSAGFVPISSSNLAIVNYKGIVSVIFSMSALKTKCALNSFYYPYDKQNCSIVIIILYIYNTWEL
jgi:nicotinic acetylcholine receptor, invertebrate